MWSNPGNETRLARHVLACLLAQEETVDEQLGLRRYGLFATAWT
jgi:hypothetical protein